MMYLCRGCGASVGCHNNTRKPLGTMANAELRKWRMKAHEVVDPLWRGGSIKRACVYAMLADRLGVDVVHIGSADEGMCREIIVAAKQLGSQRGGG